MAGENSQTLEKQLERKLHDARRIGGADRAKTCEASCVLVLRQWVIHVPIWLAELRMIERVKEFDPKLQVHPFLDCSVL